MNIGAVRQAMETTLDVIPGVNVNAYVQAQPTPPGIQILPPSVVYDYAMGIGGFSKWTVIIQGFVALTSDIGAQKLLDTMCAPAGSNSVKALLEADKTLGGLIDTLQVADQTPARQVEQPPGNPMLLVEWHLSITAKGT